MFCPNYCVYEKYSNYFNMCIRQHAHVKIINIFVINTVIMLCDQLLFENETSALIFIQRISKHVGWLR